jgi:hypothetical protein
MTPIVCGPTLVEEFFWNANKLAAMSWWRWWSGCRQHQHFCTNTHHSQKKIIIYFVSRTLFFPLSDLSNRLASLSLNPRTPIFYYSWNRPITRLSLSQSKNTHILLFVKSANHPPLVSPSPTRKRKVLGLFWNSEEKRGEEKRAHIPKLGN